MSVPQECPTRVSRKSVGYQKVTLKNQVCISCFLGATNPMKDRSEWIDSRIDQAGSGGMLAQPKIALIAFVI